MGVLYEKKEVEPETNFFFLPINIPALNTQHVLLF